MQQSPSQSFVVTLIPPTPTEETTVGDVVVGALGIAGVLLLLALVSGVVLAGVRVVWRRVRPVSDDHLPPVTPAG